MFCEKCGTEIKEGVAFCPQCGNALNVVAVVATEPAASTAAEAAQSTPAAPPAEPEQSAPPSPVEAPAQDAPTAPAVEPQAEHEQWAPPSVAAVPAPAQEPAPTPPPAPADAPADAPTEQQPQTPPQTYAPPQTQPQMAPPLAPMPAATIDPSSTDQTTDSPKKSKKTLRIILIALAILIIAVGGAFVAYSLYMQSSYDKAWDLYNSADYQSAYDGFGKLGNYEDAANMKLQSENWMNYNKAMEMYEADDFENALAIFDALGAFEDAEEMATLCSQSLDYQKAIDHFEADELDLALVLFTQLELADFEDAAEWVSKTKYEQANKLQASGDIYEAYVMFTGLGSYEDAAAKASACTTAFPADGTIYFNQSFASNDAELVLDGSGVTQASYYKLYSGETLVASFWVNANGSATLRLAPGDYSLKQASGEVWFGEEVMFGDAGDYAQLTFDTGDTFNIGSNIRLTITSTPAGDGSDVGSKPADPESF